MEIVLFGSSVNPPTTAHYAILKYFSENFEHVWLLPVYKHMYAEKSDLLDFEVRKEMCKIAFQGNFEQFFR